MRVARWLNGWADSLVAALVDVYFTVGHHRLGDLLHKLMHHEGVGDDGAR